MTLKNEIEKTRQTVKTENLALSIGEIISMYNEGELNIQPDFQRLFRWSIEKKSSLIESILINIPIPPIFVFENEEGTWELVDGLQRLSTILEFHGSLRKPDTDEKLPRSVLTGTTYLPSLQNTVWERSEDIENLDINSQVPLDKSLQLMLRRSRFDVQILQQPSDSETKFHLFQRLNRGGAYANEQEVRSCAMVMANPEAMRKVRELASNEKLRAMTSINEDSVKGQKDLDYLTRIMVHSYRDYDNKSDVQEFLNTQIIDVFEKEDIDDVILNITETIEILHACFGDRALFPFAGDKKGKGQRFSLRSLEAIFVGVCKNIVNIKALDDPENFLRNRVETFWDNEEVQQMSVGGLRGTQRLQRTVPFGTNWFDPAKA
ncbi:DUF262 domain-containing protein [Sneathiella sp. P13V-1]|uniref:DUF262 domain-containing protein n=1 Tax=Sneathiella sp. P13V-1 TaxID=2697366 RepID=UPI00187BB1A4|nr:DUF262 domain-containing protein [Sneathiella sp. P13V-1]MBE7635940.1 DUF262 domain-containing protein [Sneathiella sp. P13V-1]